MHVELLFELAPYLALGLFYLIYRHRDRKKDLTYRDKVVR